MSRDQRYLLQSGRKALHVLVLLSMLLSSGIGSPAVKAQAGTDLQAGSGPAAEPSHVYQAPQFERPEPRMGNLAADGAASPATQETASLLCVNGSLSITCSNTTPGIVLTETQNISKIE